LAPSKSEIFTYVKDSNGNEIKVPLKSKYTYYKGYYTLSEEQNTKKNNPNGKNTNKGKEKNESNNNSVGKTKESVSKNNKKESKTIKNINKAKEKYSRSRSKDSKEIANKNSKDIEDEESTKENIITPISSSPSTPEEIKKCYTEQEKEKILANTTQNIYKDEVEEMVKNELLHILRTNRYNYPILHNYNKIKTPTIPGADEQYQNYQNEQANILLNKKKMKPSLPRITTCSPIMNTSKYPDYTGLVANSPHSYGKSYNYKLKQQKGTQYMKQLYKNFNKKKNINSAEVNPKIDLNISFDRRKNNINKDI